MVRESSEAMMPGLVNEQPVSLTFGVEVRVWIIMIQFFSFFHSSNPKLTCHTLDTFVQMSSLLHKRQEDPRQPGGQELWKQDLMTRTSSASWIILHELTCFHLRCGKAGSLFVIERLGLALACAEVVLKDNNRSLFRGEMKIGRIAF